MIDYSVKRISATDAKKYIHAHHYSRGSHNGPSPCYGLFDGEEMIGCLMFATPCSERVRASVFGTEYKNNVIELHRLHILDVTPKNTESWFISRCLKQLKIDKPNIWAVISFSDSTEGHEGTIYKASNAIRAGQTGTANFYEDETGRLRHPRQCGVNINEKNKPKGWKKVKRAAKNRYLFLTPDNKRHKKQLLKLLNGKFTNGE